MSVISPTIKGQHILEKEYMRFRLVHLVVFPAQALQKAEASANMSSLTEQAMVNLACVIPRPLHSSSHNSFSVPFDGSKYSFGIALSIFFGS